jgi:hypothetical protein
MQSIIISKDFKLICKHSPDDLSKHINQYKRNILHELAISHDLNLLFACLCLKISQSYKDIYGKYYYDYLDDWEYEYLKQLHRAYSIGKLWVNIYKDNYDQYIPYGYSLDGKPQLQLVWEKGNNPLMLKKILDAGIDLDNILVDNIPDEYKNILLAYGWSSNDGLRDSKFYPENIWKLNQIKQQFTVTPIHKTPIGLIGKTIVCISDTHWEHKKLHIPGGEILICSGDLCMPWHTDLTEFLLWMGKQAHPYKILIGGNHDRLLEENKTHYLSICKQLNIVYLEDSGIEIEGIKIWGTPWTVKRPKNKNNAFTLERSDLINKWNLIPNDVNILITHCPPYGIGDCNSEYFKGPPYQGGDYGLRKTINRLHNLKLHVFGHQHFGRGLYKSSTGIYFVNAAIALSSSAYVFT